MEFWHLNLHHLYKEPEGYKIDRDYNILRLLLCFVVLKITSLTRTRRPTAGGYCIRKIMILFFLRVTVTALTAQEKYHAEFGPKNKNTI